MTRFLLVVLSCGVMFGSARPASANMIGDVLTVNRFYPDLLTLFLPPADSIPGFVTVTAVVGLEASPSSPQPSLYSIDFEATSISFDFLAPSAFIGEPGPGYNSLNPFDGLQFLGFSQSIQNVTASASGINVVELLFGTNYINLNLDGGFTAASTLVLQVDFAPAAVPEPSSFLLLGTGLGLGYLLRRRRA